MIQLELFVLSWTPGLALTWKVTENQPEKSEDYSYFRVEDCPRSGNRHWGRVHCSSAPLCLHTCVDHLEHESVFPLNKPHLKIAPHAVCLWSSNNVITTVMAKQNEWISFSNSAFCLCFSFLSADAKLWYHCLDVLCIILCMLTAIYNIFVCY